MLLTTFVPGMFSLEIILHIEFLLRMNLLLVVFQHFSVWMRFDLTNQILPNILACCILWFNCGKKEGLELESQSRDDFHHGNRYPGAGSHFHLSHLPGYRFPCARMNRRLNSLASKFEVSVRLLVQAGFSVILGGERGDLCT